jgi:hypothetical protein
MTKLVVRFGQLLLDGEFNPPPSPPATQANPSKIRLKYGYQITFWKPQLSRYRCRVQLFKKPSFGNISFTVKRKKIHEKYVMSSIAALSTNWWRKKAGHGFNPRPTAYLML